MLNKDKQISIENFLINLNQQELIWVNGYIAGLMSAKNSSVENKSGIDELQIIYITETGNAKNIANELLVQLKQHKIKTLVKSANQVQESQLLKGGYFLIIVSTHGEGELPASGKKFYSLLSNVQASLSNVHYSIIALGDSSYPLFCEAGKMIDREFKKLGANPFIEMQMNDVDLSQTTQQWLNAFQEKSKFQTTPIPSSHTMIKINKPSGIYQGKIIDNQLLSDEGSNKAVYHLSIQTDATYLPGDSLKYVPTNDREEVKKIIDTLNFDKNEIVEYKNQHISISQLLIKYLEIERLKEKNIERYIQWNNSELKNKENFIDESLLFLLQSIPPNKKLNVFDLISFLNPIEARYYSISSSPSAHFGEIHLTISEHRFLKKGQKNIGKASRLLTSLKENESLDFTIHQNSLFRLPIESKEVIMIGPGTGIAPFRSFLFERDAQNASGNNWLFFGDQFFQNDFLYQSELQNFLTSGLLTKLNTAFSRDQKNKIYVQDRMKENGKELIEWIENGAYLYVCGTKNPMSIDVENTLIELLQTYKNFSKNEALQYVENLQEEGRYMKDVY